MEATMHKLYQKIVGEVFRVRAKAPAQAHDFGRSPVHNCEANLFILQESTRICEPGATRSNGTKSGGSCRRGAGSESDVRSPRSRRPPPVSYKQSSKG